MREAELERALAGLERREQVSAIEASRLEATARSKATEWRALLRRHVPRRGRLWRRCCAGSW